MGKDEKLSTFLMITDVQSVDSATYFLSAANWDLERAIEIFYTDNSLSTAPQPSVSVWTDSTTPSARTDETVEEVPEDSDDSDSASDEDDEDDTGEQDVIDNDDGDGANNHNNHSDTGEQNDEIDDYEEEDPDIEDNDNASRRGKLASLYHAPTELMYIGPFHGTKVHAMAEDKWLLINIQCRTEFNSHLLNRDTFSDESVGQVIRSSFVFWQVDHDNEEGIKVCTFYNLASLPAILVINPITGRKMSGSSGFIDKDRIFDFLLPFMDKSPKEEINNYLFKHPTRVASELASSKTEETAVTGSTANPKYPPLPEEPSCSNELICRVGIRLPNGRRLQRKFLHSDSIDLLWSFGSSELEEAKSRPFKFVSATSTLKSIVYGSKLSFGESDLANSVISLAWE